jgi:hypothetical protein
MRIGGYNGRAYWGYHPHTARAIDCARKRTVIQVDPADKRSDQSNQRDHRATIILTSGDEDTGVVA